MCNKIGRYVLWFAQDNFASEIKQFRNAEIKNLLIMFNIKNLKIISDLSDSKPFWIVEGVEEDVRLVASRSFTLKYAVKLFCKGDSLSEFHTNLGKFIGSESDWIKKTFDSESSFKVTVETFNKRLLHCEKVDKIESLSVLESFLGEVDLKNPSKIIYYLEYYKKETPSSDIDPSEVMLGLWVRFF